MSPATKTLWLPGMVSLCCAAAVILGITRLPSTMWVDRRAEVPVAALWLSSYLAFGALGAFLSRRAGGSIRTRCFAGIFPLALHLAIIVPTIIVSILNEGWMHPRSHVHEICPHPV